MRITAKIGKEYFRYGKIRNTATELVRDFESGCVINPQIGMAKNVIGEQSPSDDDNDPLTIESDTITLNASSNNGSQISIPMTPDEDDVLCKEYSLRSDVLLQRSKKPEANKKKARAWKDIHGAVSAVNPMCKRSIEQLQRRHKHLTSKMKSKSVKAMKTKEKTGGGPSATFLTQAEHEILAVHKNSPAWIGLPNAKESRIGESSQSRPRPASALDAEAPPNVTAIASGKRPASTNPAMENVVDSVINLTSFDGVRSSEPRAAAGENCLRRPPTNTMSKTVTQLPATSCDLRKAQMDALQAQTEAYRAQTQLAEKQAEAAIALKEAMEEVERAAKSTNGAMITLRAYLRTRDPGCSTSNN